MGGLGRGHPPEVDVEAQSQGMGADGRASNRAHGLLREECFVVLVFKKKKKTLEMDFQFDEKSAPL